MFWRQEREKRSIDEILTPRDEAQSVEANEKVENGEKTPKFEEESQETRVDSIKPLDCFGMEEGKTEKWLMKCVKFWYCFMSFMWFLFGALTFAPVIYIKNKVSVVFKSEVRALLCAILLYATLILAIVLFASFRATGANVA